MIHTIALRVADEAALGFWTARLAGEGVQVERGDGRLRFADPEGLGFELVVDGSGDEPLTAAAPDIPPEHALRGFDGVRAYSADPDASAHAAARRAWASSPATSRTWRSRGPRRGGFYTYDEAPAEHGVGGSGTVHHIAWTAEDEDIEAWDERYRAAGRHTSGLVDRFYFRSVYSREPSGVLFEIATRGPGFATDEAPEQIGRSLVAAAEARAPARADRGDAHPAPGPAREPGGVKPSFLPTRYASEAMCRQGDRMRSPRRPRR